MAYDGGMSENVSTMPRARRIPAWGWGDRVRKVRREMQLSQAAFADLIGVGDKALAAWESGMNDGPDDRDVVAVRLEEETGVDRRWWLGWQDSPSTPTTPGQKVSSGWSQHAASVIPFQVRREHTTQIAA